MGVIFKEGNPLKLFLWIARLVCLPMAVWSVYGFGGPTLVELLKRKAGFSLIGAAAIVSVLVAVLVTVSLIPGMKPPTQDGEKQL